MALSCKDQGKQLSKQYYARPNVSIQEIRLPNLVINEKVNLHTAVIESPLAKSPGAQYRVVGIFQILQDLVIAEKVARRQYDEVLQFPELSPFVPDFLYIRNDEHEHEKILECILSRLQDYRQPSPYKGEIYKNAIEYPPGQKTGIFPPEKQNGTVLTPKSLGELYVTILDRFAEEEQKSVRNYEDFLVKVQQSKDALKNIPDDATYNKVAAPINELERKVNKQLNEERTHLDVVNALRDMFSNMKLGNVY